MKSLPALSTAILLAAAGCPSDFGVGDDAKTYDAYKDAGGPQCGCVGLVAEYDASACSFDACEDEIDAAGSEHDGCDYEDDYGCYGPACAAYEECQGNREIKSVRCYDENAPTYDSQQAFGTFCEPGDKCKSEEFEDFDDEDVTGSNTLKQLGTCEKVE